MFIYSVFSFLCLCAIGYSAKQDFLWSVSLTVTDKIPDLPDSRYEGEVEMLVIFKDKTQHSIVLPSAKYFWRLTYDFPIHLTSASPIEAVYLRAKGDCPVGLMPTRVLRLSRLQLASTSTNRAYTKQLDDLAIKCQAKTQGTHLTEFQEDLVLPCTTDGIRHEHRERFDMGCVARCRCTNGSIECVDMCPPQAWEPSQKCKFVHVPGMCCEDVLCQDDPKTRTCQEAKPSSVVPIDNTPVRRYPWSVLFCMNQKCSQIQGGITISEKHILTFGPDLSYLPEIYMAAGEYIVDQSNATGFRPMRIQNVTAHPDFINQDSPIADSASRLQVVELERSFQFDRQTQAANLPFDKDHCQQLSKNDCPVMAVGWDRTDETDNEIRQWWLHADKAKRDENLCKVTHIKTMPRIIPRRRGEKRACVGGLARDDCTGPLAGAVVANAADLDFLVGLTDPDAALLPCQRPGTADVLPLCKYMGWIDSLIS